MASKSVRPGSGIRNIKAQEFVSLGAYGITSDRKMVLVSCAHGLVYFRGGQGVKGDSIVRDRAPVEKQVLSEFKRSSLTGEEFTIKGVKLSSLRISGIGDNLPAVLKPPAEAVRGARVMKSGAVTGVTSGQVTKSSCEVKVRYSDGQTAKLVDQIRTTKMAEHGDSGSLLLSSDSFEPLGLLVAGNNSSTYFCKITHVVAQLNVLGVYCPLSLSLESPPSLRHLANLLIWDGLYMQRNNLTAKDPEEILADLGVSYISQTQEGKWSVSYRGTFVVSVPFVESDLGNVVADKHNKAVGVIVSGNEECCIAIPMEKLLRAFTLSLL